MLFLSAESVEDLMADSQVLITATSAREPDRIETLGAAIAAGIPPERGEYGTTFFKSVGMALFDLQAARAVYEVDRRRGLGLEFDPRGDA